MSIDDVGITWLVSFPKSGNTWLRFLTYYLHHEGFPPESRSLDKFCNSSLPPRPGQRFKKSHFVADRLVPLTGPDDRIVYIHRHPLDVLQSAANYAVLVGEAEAADRRAFVDRYAAIGGNPAWIEGHPYCGTWPENVAGWADERRRPVHMVGYEAMLDEPLATTTALARFLGCRHDAPFIREAVHANRFEALQAFEAAEMTEARRASRPLGRFSGPSRLAAAEHGYKFFNTGKSGVYGDALSSAQADAAWETMGDAARSLGYDYRRPSVP